MDKLAEQKKNLSTQQTNQLSDIDFSKIPSSDEFQKIKLKPPRRWFNSWMMIAILVFGVTFGITLGKIIIHFF